MAFVYNPDPFFIPKYQTEPEEFIAQTAKYRFRVRVNSDIITVGGKNKLCININPTEQKLMWLQGDADGKCELDGQSIEGDSTILMIQLALTILREQIALGNIAHCDSLAFEDSSKIPCKLPDGTIRTLNLATRDALIYGTTFYERKLGAQSAQDIQQFRKNRYDPNKKPFSFNFVNKELQTSLDPIYKKCDSWAAFFHTIVLQFGSRGACTVIYPWYQAAYKHISETQNATPPFFNWILNVWNQPDVPYKKSKSVNGGKWPEYAPSPNFHDNSNIMEIPYLSLGKPRFTFNKTYRRLRK